jgi:hypothetical protein
MHLAFYFPGGYMPGEDLAERKPHAFVERLAWVTLRALEQAADVVEPVLYDAIPASDLDRFRTGVIRDVRAGLEQHKPDRVTLVGKSRGVSALGVVLQEVELPADTRIIWLTPVWRNGGPNWDIARENAISALYVVGLADELHKPDRHAVMIGRTVAIPDADHRLEVSGDIFATLAAWRTMAEAVVAFASRSPMDEPMPTGPPDESQDDRGSTSVGPV